ncbi:MAG: type II toxin-antitoxin system MqsA family antitoxin [Candidatus Binatia bacterium]
MKCVVCKQAEVRSGKATVTLKRDQVTLVVTGVPARVCPNCGEQYVDEQVRTGCSRRSRPAPAGLSFPAAACSPGRRVTSWCARRALRMRPGRGTKPSAEPGSRGATPPRGRFANAAERSSGPRSEAAGNPARRDLVG